MRRRALHLFPQLGATLMLLPGLAAAQAAAPADLGTLGGESAFAQGINASGAVVGTSQTAEGSYRAFFLASVGDTIQAAGPADTPSIGLGINDLNEIVGESGRAFRQRGSTIQDLGAGLASDINNLGQVAGWRNATPEESHATVWDAAGNARDLGTPGQASYASAINDRGDVAGWITDGAGLPQAVLWAADGAVIELGTLGGRYSQALAINETGDVVGLAETAAASAHAFLWRRSTGMVDVDPDGAFSWAFGVNDVGQIVGEHVGPTGRQRAFVWTSGGGMVTLPTPAMPDSIARAVAVNDLGEIVGVAADAVRSRALRWVVPPSPAEQLSALERLVMNLGEDRAISRGVAQSTAAEIRNAARALGSRRASRAVEHLERAAERLSSASRRPSAGRVFHLLTLARRVAQQLRAEANP